MRRGAREHRTEADRDYHMRWRALDVSPPTLLSPHDSPCLQNKLVEQGDEKQTEDVAASAAKQTGERVHGNVMLGAKSQFIYCVNNERQSGGRMWGRRGAQWTGSSRPRFFKQSSRANPALLSWVQ